jgi:hypothetical protein
LFDLKQAEDMLIIFFQKKNTRNIRQSLSGGGVNGRGLKGPMTLLCR